MRIVKVETTLTRAADVERIVKGVLEQRLAACVQCVPVTSHYRWEGRLLQEAELRVEAKTTTEGSDALVSFIRREHPYALPEIVVSVVEASDAYAEWVGGEVAHG
jgi:periplasmic divalent cation tolerance protein